MFLLAVLLLVGGDGPLAVQFRVDLGLFGFGVRDEQFRERLAGGGAIAVVSPAFAQRVLEKTVIVEDQFDDVAAVGRGMS